jgi:hypothetical protein
MAGLTIIFVRNHNFFGFRKVKQAYPSRISRALVPVIETLYYFFDAYNKIPLFVNVALQIS